MEFDMRKVISETVVAGCESPARQSGRADAFTLLEVIIAVVLLTVVVTAGLSAILFLRQATSRMADYTAVVASVQGRMEAVRAASYNPPEFPFTSSTVRLTNVTTVSLSKAGIEYAVPGTNITVITPTALGHLVTVTGTFAARGMKAPLAVSLQSLVNQFSGGQQ